MTECEKCLDSIDELLSGELASELRAEVLLHIASCGSCRSELALACRLRGLALGSVPQTPERFAAFAANRDRFLKASRGGGALPYRLCESLSRELGNIS